MAKQLRLCVCIFSLGMVVGCIDIEAMNEETTRIGNEIREKRRDQQKQEAAVRDEARMPYFREEGNRVTIHTTGGTYSVTIPSSGSSGAIASSSEMTTTIDSHEITVSYDHYGVQSVTIDGQLATRDR